MNAPWSSRSAKRRATIRRCSSGSSPRTDRPWSTPLATLAEVYRRDGRLFSMGNGGSSCDAAHVAVEFLHPVTAGRPALTAVDLTADRTMITAVGNDVGFHHVFVRQIIAQARGATA